MSHPPRAGPPTGTASLSWDLGPSNSRGVRVLLYLAYGSVGSVGVVVVWLVASVLRSSGLGSDGEFRTVGTVVLGLLLLVFRGLPVELARRSGGYTTDVLREFAEVRRWRWVAGASVLAFGAFAGAAVGSGVVLLGVLLPVGGWMAGFALAHALSSSGEVDPETRTLTYGGLELDLDVLAGARRIQFGGRTLLWLSFEPGRSDFVRRLYVLPTRVTDEAWPAFEAGITREVESGDAELVRTTRRRYLACAAAFLVGGLGVSALFWWAGAPPAIAALAGAMTAMPALALFAAALRVASVGDGTDSRT